MWPELKDKVAALKSWNAYFFVALLSPYFTSIRTQFSQIRFYHRFCSAATLCLKNGHIIGSKICLAKN